ncbi:hypothetical protein P3T18_003216 [Paraburkholderia sp. GAS199]|uniref:hypothetical protein n=1 Tax=Paraburkholderia sp. GAS199 TaxID=3035126 RepID=UPI003D1D376B
MKKKIRSAEFLVAVAIVTSAAVMQIREHVLQDASATTTTTEQTTTCGAAHEGLVPAGCEATRGEAQPESAAHSPHGAPRIWV